MGVTVIEPERNSPKVIPVQNGGDGKYTFTFKPMLVGCYRLTVKVNGQDIRGSPFTWEVETWHMIGGGNGNKNLHFSRDGRTVTCTRRLSRVAASSGFSSGNHSWKVKLVAPKCFAVGVKDTKNLGSSHEPLTWQRNSKGGNVSRSEDYKDSKISSFKEDEVCGVFLKFRDSNQLVVRHLQSAESDIRDDVYSPRSPHLYLFFMWKAR